MAQFVAFFFLSIASLRVCLVGSRTLPQGEDPTVDDVFYNTLSARPLFVDYARGVVIKLDAGDLAVVLADDYFDDVDYINVASERICIDSPSSRHFYDHA
nr:unnamed protein product [Digitaria exilis]